MAQITEFPVPTPGSRPAAIVAGPNDDLWFVESASQSHTVAEITTSGTITEYNILSAYPTDSPDTITLGPDGNIWLIENYHGVYPSMIAKVSPAGVLLAEYQLAHHANGITTGPDGNLWFTEGVEGELVGHGWVAAMDTSGNIVYEIPVGQFRGQFAGGITVGSDHKLWFTEFPSDAESDYLSIGNIDPSGGVPVLTEYPTPLHVNSLSIAAGSDGNLWFPEDTGVADRVGRITLAGEVTSFAPFVTIGLYTIAPGPDGNLWLTARGSSDIYAVTTAGQPAEQIPTGGDPSGIVTGPDGKIWFTETVGNKVGRLDSLDQPSVQQHHPSRGDSAPTGLKARPTWNTGTPPSWVDLARGGAASSVYASALPVNGSAAQAGVYPRNVEAEATLADISVIDRVMTGYTSALVNNGALAGRMAGQGPGWPSVHEVDPLLLAFGDRPVSWEGSENGPSAA
jgi:virginiamycin B lyase